MQNSHPPPPPSGPKAVSGYSGCWTHKASLYRNTRWPPCQAVRQGMPRRKWDVLFSSDESILDFFPTSWAAFLKKHVKKLKIPRPPNNQPKPPHKPMLKICSTCKSEFVWEMGKRDKMGLASSQKTPRFGMVLCRSSSLPLGCDGDACDSKRIWPWSMAGARRTSAQWCSKLQRICWRYAFPSGFFVIGWKPVLKAYQAIFL